MKGFLKVFLIVTAILVITGAILGGGCCFFFSSVKDDFAQQIDETNPAILEQKAKDILDYTLPSNYTLLKALDIPLVGAKVAIFQDKSNKQILVIAEPGWIIQIDKNNFKQMLSPEEINNAIGKSNSARTVRIKDIIIKEEGNMIIAGEESPFVYAEVILEDLRKNKEMEFEGIVAITTNKENKNIVVLSGNQPGSFSINSVKEFLSSVK